MTPCLYGILLLSNHPKISSKVVQKDGLSSGVCWNRKLTTSPTSDLRRDDLVSVALIMKLVGQKFCLRKRTRKEMISFITFLSSDLGPISKTQRGYHGWCEHAQSLLRKQKTAASCDDVTSGHYTTDFGGCWLH